MSDRPIVPINCFFQGCYNPAYEVAVGVPCRVLREITDEDKSTYPMYKPD